jgi:hypothetical protein
MKSIDTESSQNAIAPPAPSSSPAVHQTLLKLRPQIEAVKTRIQELPTQSEITGVFFDEFSDDKKLVDEMQRIIAEEMQLKMVVSTDVVSMSGTEAEVMATIYLLSDDGYLPFVSRSGSTQKNGSNAIFANKHLQAAETLAVIKVLGAIGLLSKSFVNSQEEDIDSKLDDSQNDKEQPVLEPEVDETELSSVIPKSDSADKAEDSSKVKADEAKAKKAADDKAKADEAKAKKAADDKAKADEAKAKKVADDKAKADEAKAKKAADDKVKADEAKAKKAADDKVKADEAKAKKAADDKAETGETKAKATPRTRPKRRGRGAGRRAALSAIINDDASSDMAQEESSISRARKPAAKVEPVAEPETAPAKELEEAPEAEPKEDAPKTKRKARSGKRRTRRQLVIDDQTKLQEPVVEDPEVEKSEVNVQSKIAGTSVPDVEMSRQEMVTEIRNVADSNNVPVSIIIEDALNRDAAQFDDISDQEVGYIYNKYVISMGDKS